VSTLSKRGIRCSAECHRGVYFETKRWPGLKLATYHVARSQVKPLPGQDAQNLPSVEDFPRLSAFFQSDPMSLLAAPLSSFARGTGIVCLCATHFLTPIFPAFE
jgi:hypothetical protein